MRPRTVHRVPQEKRWKDKLEFVIGLPWKINKDHEPGEEVFLDIVPPAPSPHPMTPMLPPTVFGDPHVRRIHVKKEADLDPAEELGIGYTEGCPGCKALMKGSDYAVGYNEGCKRRVRERLARVLRGLQGSWRREPGKTSSWLDGLKRVSRRQQKRTP